MVGASPDKTKFSYGVLRVLHETGYDMIPVNPKPEIKEIRNLKVLTFLPHRLIMLTLRKHVSTCRLDVWTD